METNMIKAAQAITQSRLTVALTGAGISVESGIPPFRGPGSLWEKIDPTEFAHIDAFMKNPARVWEVLMGAMKEILDTARPNKGHLALAELERRGLLSAVITQNVDSLHQKAGSEDVIEFHGTFATLVCMECGSATPSADIRLNALPPRCPCGGIYRPDCVFFGEAIPMDALERSREFASQCEVMLVVGTSAMVQPAAMMPVLAKQNGATVIEINPTPTPLTTGTSDIFLKGNAGPILTRLTEAIPIPARG
ncbi:SIR2 family NAD-dependent protein deacylase [Desulfoluna spongiiphila]|uniref:protein acetyllysine N-acetyltransferase n=1 Tax=Desulfoluna spongiiphila TaxID=419481 RepID=A0A1G5GGM8_9BACT|nr:Sir2 family NAD-dependent protein deacetylase [Desulfoluna spongiiphila]SCY50703.1 NAD-dependent deacetylase [Desulfoluna spongiiphila]VVS93567.1 sirtuin family [Desulfoluna spongiiphila]